MQSVFAVIAFSFVMTGQVARMPFDFRATGLADGWVCQAHPTASSDGWWLWQHGVRISSEIACPFLLLFCCCNASGFSESRSTAGTQTLLQYDSSSLHGLIHRSRPMSTNHYHVGLFRHSPNLKTYPAGSKVFTAGDIGRVMYAVKTGKVSVSIDGQPVDYLGEDEIFGEMALLENLPRSATVVAVEETTLVEIDEVQFLNTVRQNPYFALQMLKILSARLRQSKVT